MKRVLARPRGMALLALLLVGSAVPAYAYVDPGSASMFFQLLIGTLLGAAFAVRLYWKKLKNLFRRGLSGPDDSTAQ